MRIRVDRAHVDSLIAHLDGQGFPAVRVEDGVDVLFPASPPLFAAAVELDDWLARTGADAAVAIELQPAHAARGAARRRTRA